MKTAEGKACAWPPSRADGERGSRAIPGDLERPERGKTSRPWGHTYGLGGQTDAKKAWERISTGERNSLVITPFMIRYHFRHLRKAILLQTKKTSP